MATILTNLDYDKIKQIKLLKKKLFTKQRKNSKTKIATKLKTQFVIKLKDSNCGQILKLKL